MSDKPCIVAVGAHAADMEFTAGCLSGNSQAGSGSV